MNATIIELALYIAYIAICVVLTVIIAIQKGKDASIGSMLGAQQTSDFWEKAKGRTKEGRIGKLTVVFSILFFAGTIALLIVPRLLNK